MRGELDTVGVQALREMLIAAVDEPRVMSW
jgi:hypothetical protein